MAGMSNWLRNKIADFVNRGVAWVPPATIYIELVSTTPSPSVAGTPLAGTGYARKALAQNATAMSATNGDGLTTNPSSGTTGTTSNNVTVDFGVAGAAWGTATHWESYDALVAGNRLNFGFLVNAAGVVTPRSIALGDPVIFPISALRWLWV